MKNFSDSILAKAFELLSKYPLCNSCLGRCFARLGYKLTNEERGKAIKISLILELDRKIKDHELSELNEIREVLYNIGRQYAGIYDIYFAEGEFQERPCYICNSEIEAIKKDFFEKTLSLLKKISESNGKINYVLGVKLSERLKEIENNFVFQNGLVYYESIRNEIKREVGKMLSKEGYPPSIENADLEIVYDIDTRTIYTVSKKFKNLYVYNRLSRKVPISSWYSTNSLENSLGAKIIVPFIEPSDVRILDEYPIILEKDNDIIEVRGYFMRKIGQISKREIAFLMTTKPTKRTYKVLFYSKNENKDAEKIYDNIYQVFIEAKNFQELKEKLNQIQGEIISIDLVSSEGKHKNFETKL